MNWKCVTCVVCCLMFVCEKAIAEGPKCKSIAHSRRSSNDSSESSEDVEEYTATESDNKMTTASSLTETQNLGTKQVVLAVGLGLLSILVFMGLIAITLKLISRRKVIGDNIKVPATNISCPEYCISEADLSDMIHLKMPSVQPAPVMPTAPPAEPSIYATIGNKSNIKNGAESSESAHNSDTKTSVVNNRDGEMEVHENSLYYSIENMR